ncbi:ubx domain containing protein [Stylonychia lemnae]|uniref:Ubx domain containing protein n=1 Tax=Stylonychia lemnae TaxID=5949 RepID=A0A078A3S3_STYLE|nr:ubx domain containing protein [Stylonychia lemnae]|eukprot:CDW76903.1 ubx domain containing protein [Stylonychia lemnae]
MISSQIFKQQQNKSVQQYNNDNSHAQNFGATSQNDRPLGQNVQHDEDYIPPNDSVYRQDDRPQVSFFGLRDTYAYNNQYENYQSQQPLLNDLFGGNVTQYVSGKVKGAKNFIGKMWGSYMKGVSPGGEEFTSKIDKMLPKGVFRPKFLHGTMKEIAGQNTNQKPILLYLSGDDEISRQFEVYVLTQEGVISRMSAIQSLKNEKLQESLSQTQQRQLEPEEEIKENYHFYEHQDEDEILAKQLQREYEEEIQREAEQQQQQQKHFDEQRQKQLLQQREEEERQRKQKEVEDKKKEDERIKQQLIEQKESEFKDKLIRLGQEPEQTNPESVQIAFRKPNGNERIQRRFLVSDLIEKLYDFIDTLEQGSVGFDKPANKDEDIQYELVLPPQPQIKVLNDKTKTLKEENITRSALINIKQLN